MEWVETTGRTVEEALDAALDELGVDNDEVEYEVLEEPRGGFLGRREARIRARVKPVSREKPGERRRRSGRREQERGGESRGPRGGGGSSGRAPRAAAAPSSDGGESGDGVPAATGRRRRGGRGRGTGRSASGGEGREERPAGARREEAMNEEIDEVSLEEQRASAEEFTRGIVDAFEFGARDRKSVV